MNRSASCYLNQRFFGTKKPAQHVLKQVALSLAVFMKRPES